MAYFRDITTGIRTTLKGLSLTWRHIRNATHRRNSEGITSQTYFNQPDGLVTLQYPHEQLPIPDNGRYRLRNEIEDCIVCDKCAKVCPVDCISIEAIKATEEIGRASDGSPIRLYAGKFDIDMAKCCYCGLCTVVCPTECLTMDKKFDYSEFELGKLTYSFSNLTAEQADEKRSLYEQFLREKEAAKVAQVAAKATIPAATPDATATPAAPRKPVFKPTARPAAVDAAAEPPTPPAAPTEPAATDAAVEAAPSPAKRPVFRPTQKPKVQPEHATVAPTDPVVAPEPVENTSEAAPKPKAAPFRPTMKPASADSPVPADKPATPKVAGFKPTMKSATKPVDTTPEPASDTPAPKPVGFRPTMKPASAELATKVEEDKPKPKPAGFRPTMKPVVRPAATEETLKPIETDDTKAMDGAKDIPDHLGTTEAPKPKPAFRPTMRPRPKSDDDSQP